MKYGLNFEGMIAELASNSIISLFSMFCFSAYNVAL